MKRFSLAASILAAVLAVFVFAGTTSAQIKGDPAAVVEGNNGFAAELYGQLAQKPGNLFFSPYSISNALAMTYAGARGKTAQEMATTLHFDLEAGKFHPAFAELIRQLQGPVEGRKYKLKIANRLWGQKDYGFLPAFLKISQDQYQAGLKEVDFVRDTEGARKTINAWVEDETNQKIKNLLQPGILNADTRLVLTNAIYFKAAWMRPFPVKATKPGDFHVGADKKVTVPMIHLSQAAGFFDDGSVLGLDLPYEGYELSMLVLLPKKRNGLPALEKMLTAANLKKWQGQFAGHQVEISLPKFKMTAEFNLNEVLKNMGMREAFGNADFSGMTTEDKLSISHVLHKAFVDVNEAGTEAAAATAVVMKKKGTPKALPAAVFNADHPFVFLIRDFRTGSILFMARVANP